MSLVDTSPGLVITAPQRRPFWRPSTIICALLAVVLLTLIAQHVINAGYLRKDIEALQAGEAWRTGGWLSQLVLRVIDLLPGTDLQQGVLSLISAAVSGIALGALYGRLRANGWYVFGAVCILLALGFHAGALYTLSASSRAIPLYIAFAALVPAIRSLEDVGDVQAAIGVGLLLPLLLLASPISMPLILPIAIGAALADPDGRRNASAFLAMLLVAILPSVIVGIGIVGFIIQAQLDLAEALLPYVRTYSDLHFGDIGTSFLGLLAFAPVMIVPIAYCFWPGLPERRHIWSALAIIVLPAYLATARVTLTTTMTQIVPALALIAAFVSWLSVVRLPTALRVLSLVLLAVSAVLSWALTGLWDDPAWKAALLNFVTVDLGNLTLRPGV